MERGSKQVARAALAMAMTASREEEKKLKEELRNQEIRGAAVDFGGDSTQSVKTIIERAVVAGKREFLIRDVHAEEGAVAGATHEALSSLAKGFGFEYRRKDRLSPPWRPRQCGGFCAIGMLHLDEVAVGLGHRAI